MIIIWHDSRVYIGGRLGCGYNLSATYSIGTALGNLEVGQMDTKSHLVENYLKQC